MTAPRTERRPGARALPVLHDPAVRRVRAQVRAHVAPRQVFRRRTPREVERACLHLMIALEALVVLVLLTLL